MDELSGGAAWSKVGGRLGYSVKYSKCEAEGVVWSGARAEDAVWRRVGGGVRTGCGVETWSAVNGMSHVG